MASKMTKIGMSLLCLGMVVQAVAEVVESPPEAPAGLPKIEFPETNPYSSEKAALGKLLYFDKRLSGDGSISCASCHEPDKAFTDGSSVSTGISGHKGLRHAPTIINSGYNGIQFWDGRALTLEDQAKGPISNPLEMTFEKDQNIAHKVCVDRLRAIPGYRRLFKIVFGTEDFTIDDVAMAIATFERTIFSGDSPYDRYQAGDKNAMTKDQIEGMEIFFGKGGCDKCHSGPLFTNNEFANIGVGMKSETPDLGRYLITGKEKDKGAFKVPSLREVANTAPYMHNGGFNSLELVIHFYDIGGFKNPWLDPRMKPLHLTKEEKYDLVQFLKALNGDGWQHVKPPTNFPQ